MPEVTIGFVPRDRFCMAAKCLESIFAGTKIPFELIVVDTAIPPVFRRQMHAVLAGRDNVHVLEVGEYLLTHQSHNLVAKEYQTPYLCLLENDNTVEPGWLEALVAACEEFPAGVAVPFISERLGVFERVHFDERQGHIERVQAPDGVRRRILWRDEAKEDDLGRGRRRLGMIETHCLLFTREALDRFGSFDERLVTRTDTDVSLRLDEAGIVAVLEPKARITHHPPPPIHPEEREFYLKRWDVARAEENHEYLTRKWALEQVPNSLGFVRLRHGMAAVKDPRAQLRQEEERRARIEATAEDLSRAVPAGSRLLLVDQAQLDHSDIVRDRLALPFLERDGEYWGAPPDAAAAIAELEREREAGAGYIAFAWPAFWWLDHYAEFAAHLRQRYACRLENERLVVFELAGAAAS